MENEPDFVIRKTKGVIAETIIELMLQDLGFYVIKTGKEYTASPVTKLHRFIQALDKNRFKHMDNKHWFTIEREGVIRNPITFIKKLSEDPIAFINKLPDFVVIGQDAKVHFIEVKFRKNAEPLFDDFDVLELYPRAVVIIVNLKTFIPHGKYNFLDEETIKLLKDSRIHVWSKSPENSTVMIKSFSDFLKEYLQVNSKVVDEIVLKYENIITKCFENYPDVA